MFLIELGKEREASEMVYRVNSKLVGTLVIPSLKGRILSANNKLDLTEEQLKDHYIMVCIKKGILVAGEVKKEPVVEVAEKELAEEVKPNTASWDAQEKKLIDVAESKKQVLPSALDEEKMEVQAKNIDLTEESPKKKTSKKMSKAMKKAQDALNKAAKDPILDLNKLANDESEKADFVMESTAKDDITFVDIEQEKERAKRITERRIVKNNEEVS